MSIPNSDEQPAPYCCPHCEKAILSPVAEKPVPRGLRVFGAWIDPIEIGLHVLIVIAVGVPAVRASAKPDYKPADAALWVATCVGLSALVRVAPTDQINAYLKVLGRSPD